MDDERPLFVVACVKQAPGFRVRPLILR